MWSTSRRGLEVAEADQMADRHNDQNKISEIRGVLMFDLRWTSDCVVYKFGTLSLKAGHSNFLSKIMILEGC